ncbi:MAG: DEAD/DEAH box helicase [Acidimicrobiales bacterium]
MSRPTDSTLRVSFERSCPYPLDRFQLEAMDLLDAGRSVLVTAPTGSGKTVVAEYAIHRALGEGLRAFYTSPLKALSNQKFGDLARRYGTEHVGLLTGDNSINSDARIVVMTTEVLRNMIHSERTSLSQLGYVVLDEVHFLENPYRGGVWEEVILGSPPEVRLVCLSATVANGDELAGWIGRVRGDTGIVREDRRPVALHDLFAIGQRSNQRVQMLPVFENDRPNTHAMDLDQLMARHGPRTGRPRPRLHQSGNSKDRTYRPRRPEMVERLHEADLLPAIYFIFSRSGCDEAVRYCLDDGLRLTSAEERQAIREIAEDHVDAISDDDLAVLGYGQFVAALEAGLAAHHAGMVPPFREAVEACFAEALVKVVFATETLALGINMPARCVVIEDLTKYGGSGHQELTPGEYTQLTGRAGRRGIDDVGYAVVLASPFHSFEDVARLAGAPGRALTSSFRPTYNLTISLVRRFDRIEAYRIVTSSFAQWLSEEDLGSQLTSVLHLLEARGYLQGWRVTEMGDLLGGIYHEADLLIAESLRAGLLDSLDPAALAATVSAFCFESRREREGALVPPSGAVSERLKAIGALSEELGADESSRALRLTRGIDPGFASLARDWARGKELRRVLVAPGKGAIRGHQKQIAPPMMTGGDFVRNVKQVIDLLRQIATVAPKQETRTTADRAAHRLLRGVVAASSQIGTVTRTEAPPSADEVAGAGSAETIHVPGRHAS